MPENGAFLFGAFAVAWVLLAGYLFFLGSRIGGLRQDVEALRDDLAARQEEGERRNRGETAPETTSE